MSYYSFFHRSKSFVQTLKKSLKAGLLVKTIICQRRLHVAEDFVQTSKSFESWFACQDHNLPTTITCHRRLVLLMAERQKKPRLIQRHFSGIGFIMNGSLECRATGKTIFTTTITLAIIQPSHQYFCEPQP